MTQEEAFDRARIHSDLMLGWMAATLTTGRTADGTEVVFVPEGDKIQSITGATTTVNAGLHAIEFWATQAIHYGKIVVGMTPTEDIHPDADLNRAAQEAELLSRHFQAKFLPKYVKGQKEHGGELLKVPIPQLIHHIKEEIMDLWAYASAIEAQIPPGKRYNG